MFYWIFPTQSSGKLLHCINEGGASAPSSNCTVALLVSATCSNDALQCKEFTKSVHVFITVTDKQKHRDGSLTVNRLGQRNGRRDAEEEEIM